MRIDKKNNATYIKELDEMEKYFLNMFKRFIENDPGFLEESVESVITEAVKRAKKEIIFETSAGVLSINDMSGVVKLTLDDLGGEPKIPVKYSAFNKPFGTRENTVCEGNDVRLSDARLPLAHNHNDLYYQKFETATHTQNGYMDRLDKIKLDGIDENANNYIHPSGSGYNHIPAGGSSGQYLTWYHNGEAKWTDLALNKVTTTTDGIMSKEDKIKLDGIEANAKTYVHPTSSGYKHIPAGGSTGQILKWANNGDAYWGDDVQYIHPATHPATMITTDSNHQFVTNEQIDEWSTKPVGNDGEVYFISGNDSSTVVPAYILYKGAAIESDEELSKTKTKIVDFSEVFNSWYRFSHNFTTTQPASLAETQKWQYVNGEINCQINSGTYIGFISKDKYDTYTHEVTVKSTAGDNDRIGVIIAFAKDSNGIEHTISALRDMEGSYNWFLVYDYAKSTQQIIDYKTVITGDVRTNWNNIPNGSRIRVERNGNLISVYASPFNSTTIDVNSKLTLDLSSNSKFDIFKGPSPYGYSCQSQDQSTFTDVVFTGDIDKIYDIRNGDVWVRTNASWVIDSTKNIGDDIGVGKFIFNEYTKKLFYIKDRDNVLSLTSNGLSATYQAKLDSIEYSANNYVHPTEPGYKHIPTGGNTGEVLQWKSDGEAEWVDLDTNKVTFESARIKKRGICNITLNAGVLESHAEIDLSTINFYNAPTYSAYYINDDGTKEQLPTILFNSLDVSDILKAYINTTTFKINIVRRNSTAQKTYKIYFEILDVDNSVTIQRAKSINVLNIYPGVPANGSTYTFTNWKGETSTLPMTAQVKRWMEEPNDESPKGYGQGLINVTSVNIDDFNLNPYNYLKDSSGNWIYDTVYLGAWDSNNGKVYSEEAVNAIKSLIAAGKGYIGGHDTLGHLAGTTNTLESTVGIINYTSSWCSNSEITVSKSGFVSSFPWNLGDLNTKLNVPISHVTNQFYIGDVWFKYVPTSGFVETTTVNGTAGTNNFYLGTFNNTAFIQTGHSNGVASPDEQKILANVFYYLANKGV